MTVAPSQLAKAVLKPSQVAARLHVARTTVYRWMESGELPYIELGGSRYVAVAAYERFVERRKKGVTLEAQAARYIGEGVEVEGEVDMLAGLSSPRRGAAGPPRAAGRAADPVEDARERLRVALAGYEARYGLASERVHREHLVEGNAHVAGVPDAVTVTWARLYAAYANLSLVPAGRR